MCCLPLGAQRVHNIPGFNSTARIPLSLDTGKPHTAMHGEAETAMAGAMVVPLTNTHAAPCGALL